MKVFDLNELEPESYLTTDLCIIGSGPAGLSIANEFAGTGTRVLVVESGGLRTEPETQSLYAIENTGAPRVMDQDEMRTRILGGTSHIWTGRCAPFDAVDFERRAWIPFSGWPLGRVQMEPYVKRGAKYLGLAPADYDESLWREFGVDAPQPPLKGASLRPMFWQFSRRRNGSGSAHFGRDWVDAEAPNVEVLLHANVTQIHVKGDGTAVESVDVRSLGGKRARIAARMVVLCCGGIENARLLLASNGVAPAGLGNEHDMVGRCLMDHFNITAGCFGAKDARGIRARFGHYWLDDADGRHVYLHGLGLSPEAQEREQLVNCHAYIEEIGPSADDGWAALKRLRSSVRSRQIPKAEVVNILSHAGEIGGGLYRRGFQHRPALGGLVRVELHLMMEQAPDPESRVTLSREKRDRLGMPLTSIHWKIGARERMTARRMVQLVSEEFRGLGLAVPREVPRLEEESDWIGTCTEKAHPTGTTRMSSDPKDGVVDANCQVHGVRGLFVAGSSVFPTAGAANPTLMIVAAAVRLADHLKAQAGRATEPVVAASVPEIRERYQYRSTTAASSDALRVGFVGAGGRLNNLYVPILRRLSDRFEMVGFSSSSGESTRRFESGTGLRSFQSAAEMVERAKPELLIVAVPDRLNEATVSGLIDLKVPILAETPLAWSAAGVERVMQKAAASGVVVGVAEQFPSLPMDQFRRLVVDSGMLGEIHTVLNNFESYSYHGIAQIRRFLKGRAIEAQCTEQSSGVPRADGVKAVWLAGSAIFAGGGLLLHNFVTPEHGFAQSVCLYGTLGAMEGDAIRLLGATSKKTGCFRAARIENAAGHLAAISAEVGGDEVGGASRISWVNPFAAYPFSDQEIAVASLLQGMRLAVREGTKPLYSAGDFLGDIEIVQAFRYSASRDGAPVPLPLVEWKQKGRQLSSVRYWKRKLGRR